MTERVGPAEVAAEDAAEDAAAAAATRTRSAIAIVLFTGVLIAAGLGHADRDRATWFGQEGPACPLRSAIGDRRCPGCGLSRATVLTAHGHFRDAFYTHPAGWFIPLFAVAGIVLHADIARHGVVRAGHRRMQRMGRWLFLGSLVIGGFVRVML